MKKFTSLSLSRYLAELSSKNPVPGGGSASAYAGALGMGLAEMVARIGLKRASAETKPVLQQTIKALQKLRKNALQVVDLDPKVYGEVMAAYAKTRKLTDAVKKNHLIDEALDNSFRLQADLALLVAMAKESLHSLEGLVKGSITNDLRVSRSLLGAAFRGSYETAKINMVYLKDSEKKARAERALEELQKRFENGNSQHSGGGPGFARGLRSSTRPGLRASGGWSSEARTLD